MSDAVVVALLQLAGSLVLLILGARLNGKVNQVREQVKNGHSTNMREEQDERHIENRTTLEGNARKLDEILEELGVLREHVKRLWSRSDRHTQRIEEIDERTQPRAPISDTSRFEPRAGKHTERRKPNV